MADEKQYQPHQLRVIEERKALSANINKLFDFLNGGIFQDLPAAEKHLLMAQYSCMETYERILSARIDAF